jgi:hypothetical protein
VRVVKGQEIKLDKDRAREIVSIVAIHFFPSQNQLIAHFSRSLTYPIWAVLVCIARSWR